MQYGQTPPTLKLTSTLCLESVNSGCHQLLRGSSMGTTWVPIYSHMGPHLLPRGSPIAPHGPPIANLGPIDAAHMVGGVCSGPLMICKAVDLSRKNKGVQGGPCGTKTSYIVCKDLAHCKHQDLWTHPSLCAWAEWKCVQTIIYTVNWMVRWTSKNWKW